MCIDKGTDPKRSSPSLISHKRTKIIVLIIFSTCEELYKSVNVIYENIFEIFECKYRQVFYHKNVPK